MLSYVGPMIAARTAVMPAKITKSSAWIVEDVKDTDLTSR